MLKKYRGKIIMIIIIIIILFVSGFMLYKNLTKKKDANTIINEMATKYYEQYYNNLKSDNPKTYKEKLANEAKKGFRKSLFDISREVDHEDKYRLYNSKESGIKCDFYKTYVTYTPVAPYEINNYDMKIIIDCNEK